MAARRIPRLELLKTKTPDIEKPIPNNTVMVTLYHPHHDTLRNIVKKNWDHYLKKV